jgi:hypothetical protein
VNLSRIHTRFELSALDATLTHYLGEVDHVAERIAKLEEVIDDAVQQQAPAKVRAVIEALQAWRGVAQTMAATVVCELGGSRVHVSGWATAGWCRENIPAGTACNAVPSAKPGCAFAARFVEAAWTYQHRPNLQGRLLRRQKSLPLSDAVKRIAWNAPQRLHKRFTALTARGKNNNQAVTALARELLGFIVGHRRPYPSPVPIEPGSPDL